MNHSSNKEARESFDGLKRFFQTGPIVVMATLVVLFY